METLVIDASIAIKWVVEEDGTADALFLRSLYRFAAPDLLVAECANILWKKTQRKELTATEAVSAASLLERSNIELFPMRPLLAKATSMANDIGHPAYDCLYLCLAVTRNLRFVTADQRLLARIGLKGTEAFANLCVSMDQIVLKNP